MKRVIKYILIWIVVAAIMAFFKSIWNSVTFYFLVGYFSAVLWYEYRKPT